MLSAKEMAEISNRASELTCAARNAHKAWQAAQAGEKAPENAPILAKADSVAFYMTQEDTENPEMEPIFFDQDFHQKKKHGKWREVPAPDTPKLAPITDTHAHIHMLPNPALAIARAGGASMKFLDLVTDIAEDGMVVFDNLEAWKMEASIIVRSLVPKCCGGCAPRMPKMRITAGVHPHNAKLFDDAMEQKLRCVLARPEVGSLGEIGLDYHYDLSPRDVQRDVFAREIQLAHETGLPACLHIRDAHEDALEILNREGFPEAGTLLHCCGLSAEELQPWIDAGCYIAYGGSLTFKDADAVREAAPNVPENRLLTETDAPFMAPVPLRGVKATPDMVLFVIDMLAELRGIAGELDRRAFHEAVVKNAMGLLDRDPTPWQVGHGAGDANAGDNSASDSKNKAASNNGSASESDAGDNELAGANCSADTSDPANDKDITHE